ncbi:hypothetical protein XANCAGTX0491_004175 [Xanthoria calcicola]
MSTDPTAWVQEPDGRGTWGLLLSCFLTLVLCTYTAIHLNIQPHQSTKKSNRRRILATVLANVVPEWLFVIALSQWNCARQLQSKLNHLPDDPACDCCDQAMENEIQGAETDDRVDPSGDIQLKPIRRSGTLNELERGPTATEEATRTLLGRSPTSSEGTTQTAKARTSSVGTTQAAKAQPSYSLRQAFFIVAGGLAVEVDDSWGKSAMTITPAGAVELAKLGLLEPIPTSVIEDKSKADPITKTFVCIQAGWFVVQCIARVSQGLPLSLLEIYVLAHVCLAFFMYLLWFAKPYDAISPIIMDRAEVVHMAALFTVFPDISTEADFKPEVRCLSRDNLTLSSPKLLRPQRAALAKKAIQYIKKSHKHIQFLHSNDGTIGHLRTYLTTKLLDFDYNPGGDLSETKSSVQEKPQRFKSIYRILPLRHDGIFVWTTLLISFYGAFHLSAWNAHFPTNTERWLWRRAGLLDVIVPCLYYLKTFLSMFVYKVFGEAEDKRLWLAILLGPFHLIFAVTNNVLLLATLIVRLFFLVEALVSLRAPVSGMYETAEWTQYFPHW